jgi:ribonuclease P protein subunit POP4
MSRSQAVPKEHTVFRFAVPLPEQNADNAQTDEPKKETKQLLFEIHGSQFENRPADRANRKFKWKAMDYL